MHKGHGVFRFVPPMRTVALLVKTCVITAAIIALQVREGQGDPLIMITTRDGKRDTYTFSDFDAKHLTLELRIGKDERKIDLRGVSRMQFAQSDSTAAVAASDSTDLFIGVDGRSFTGIFRRMDDENVHVLLTDGHRPAKLRWSSLRECVFGAGVLDVDRREFGGGFNLIGKNVEIQIAAMSSQEIEADTPILDDTTACAYVQRLGQRLARSSKRPDVPYQFSVLNSGQVNAFTIGGGKVYVYRGLIEQMGSEADLAGVLAHEIGHNVGKHTARELSKSLLLQGVVAATGELVKTKDEELGGALEGLGGALVYFRTLKYSRDDEREADYLAVYNVSTEGINPAGMVSAFEALKRGEEQQPSKFEVFFQTHPSLDERIENTSTELQRIPARSWTTDSPAFQEMKAHLLSLPRPVAHRAVVTDTVVVEAEGRVSWGWTLDTTRLPNCHLHASFEAAGGSGNDIQLLVLDEINYKNYSNSHAASTVYDSGVVTAGDARIPIEVAGTYYLVLNNEFSVFTNKTVVIDVQVEYTE